jgi:multidrug resistance efflux pump
LNLSYTKVFAPVDGYVTNMNTSEGTYITAGVQLMALVDTSSIWIAGYFKETQLPRIQVGQKAIVTVMGHENQPFQGVVRSVGWGVYVQDGSSLATGFVLPVSGSNRAVPQNLDADWKALWKADPIDGLTDGGQ